MTLRVDVKPELLRWARERAGIEPEALVRRFPKYREWERGEKQPTFKQLEQLAKATHAPIGSFFLSEPLQEPIPIPDLRTLGNRFVGRPSVDLLDTVYLCQQRQDWYREFARMEGEDPLPFFGSATPGSDVLSTASKIRAALGFDLNKRRTLRTWTDALRRFIEQADLFGVLVMVNGVVGNNTRRKLDPDEFRGLRPRRRARTPGPPFQGEHPGGTAPDLRYRRPRPGCLRVGLPPRTGSLAVPGPGRRRKFLSHAQNARRSKIRTSDRNLHPGRADFLFRVLPSPRYKEDIDLARLGGKP